MRRARILDECFTGRSRLFSCFVLCVAVLGACRKSPGPESGPGTQIVIIIDADSRSADLGSEVVLDVVSFSASGEANGSKLSNSFPIVGPEALPWPITFSIVPRNGDLSRIYQFKATLVDNGQPIAVLRAVASYVPQQLVEVPLRFSVACLYEASLGCSELQTCDVGSCVDTGLDPGFAPSSTATTTVKPSSTANAVRKDAAGGGAVAGRASSPVAGSPAPNSRAGAAGNGASAAAAGSAAPDAGSDDPSQAQQDTSSAPVCGNGIVESGETCDPVDSCVTADDCQAADSCLRSALAGAAASCNAVCETYEIVQCVPGDGCCPSNCSSNDDSDCSGSCGDGVVDTAAGERCEPASDTRPCPSDCDDGDACTRDYLTGSAANCNASCSSMAIVWPLSGDGCCPPNANANLDFDCEPICGNRVVEPGERCDGRCPSVADCDDGNPCTRDGLAGTGCDRHCTHLAVENLVANDGCCPVGANANNDNDCSPVCGNRVIERGETCDGNCRVCTDNDTDPCTVVTTSGPECSPTCTRETITQLIDNDRCCPRGATQSSDSDCQPAAPVCGNRKREAGEDCDGPDCPSCDDRNACTQDRSVPSPDACHPVCENTPKTPNNNMPDGCCPSGADASTDTDCAPAAPECGNGIKELGEMCDPCPTSCDDGKVCTHDELVGSGCNASCTHDPIAAGPSDGCCPREANMASDPDCAP